MLVPLFLLSIIVPMETMDQRVITSLKYSKNRVQLTIVNGNQAESGYFPYMVSVKISSKKMAGNMRLWTHYCGGSILHRSKVLTAAHCFELNNYYYYYHHDKMRVVAGSLLTDMVHTGESTNNTDNQWRQISTVKMHVDFNFPLNDIALIFLDAPLLFCAYVHNILPAMKTTDYAGHCFSAGFGDTSRGRAKDLLWAEIGLMSRYQCAVLWEMNMDTFLCTYSVLTDVAGGDSGGPLVCFGILDPVETGQQGVLVGVVSGKNHDRTTLYTRVSAYKHWIQDTATVLRAYRVIVCFCAIILFGMWFGSVLFYLTCPTTQPNITRDSNSHHVTQSFVT